MTEIHSKPATELLPCPFCGAAPRTDLMPTGTTPGWIQCSKCRCERSMFDAPDEAIADWNTRSFINAQSSNNEAVHSPDEAAASLGLRELQPAQSVLTVNRDRLCDLIDQFPVKRRGERRGEPIILGECMSMDEQIDLAIKIMEFFGATQTAVPPHERWRMMDTAPRDGTPILVSHSAFVVAETLCWVEGLAVSVPHWCPYAGHGWKLTKDEEVDARWQPLPVRHVDASPHSQEEKA